MQTEPVETHIYAKQQNDKPPVRNSIVILCKLPLLDSCHELLFIKRCVFHCYIHKFQKRFDGDLRVTWWVHVIRGIQIHIKLVSELCQQFIESSDICRIFLYGYLDFDSYNATSKIIFEFYNISNEMTNIVMRKKVLYEIF